MVCSPMQFQHTATAFVMCECVWLGSYLSFCEEHDKYWISCVMAGIVLPLICFLSQSQSTALHDNSNIHVGANE